jgi:hypothetical protein
VFCLLQQDVRTVFPEAVPDVVGHKALVARIQLPDRLGLGAQAGVDQPPDIRVVPDRVPAQCHSEAEKVSGFHKSDAAFRFSSRRG